MPFGNPLCASMKHAGKCHLCADFTRSHADRSVYVVHSTFIDANYPRRARSALGVDIVLTLDVCLYVCMFVCLYVSALERKRLIGMT